MDPKEFKQRLDELAELEVVKVTGHQVRPPDEPIVIRRDNQDLVIDDKNNPTLIKRVKKLKNELKKCSDCDNMVKNRIVSIKQYLFPIKHWRRHCNICNGFEDPRTGKFNLRGIATQNVYNAVLRPQMSDEQKESVFKQVKKKPAK
jgi:hypothetical protein